MISVRVFVYQHFTSKEGEISIWNYWRILQIMRAISQSHNSLRIKSDPAQMGCFVIGKNGLTFWCWESCLLWLRLVQKLELKVMSKQGVQSTRLRKQRPENPTSITQTSPNLFCSSRFRQLHRHQTPYHFTNRFVSTAPSRWHEWQNLLVPVGHGDWVWSFRWACSQQMLPYRFLQAPNSTLSNLCTQFVTETENCEICTTFGVTLVPLSSDLPVPEVVAQPKHGT